MLRQYGGRVLLFNMNSQRTKGALETARETNNGYILVSEDIPLDTLEAVFDLDNDTWDFAYAPETRVPQLIVDQGIEEATHLLHYYSTVVHKEEMPLGELPPIAHRQVLRDIGNHYLTHLRYPGGTPADATAGTTASNERSDAAKDDAINRVVREVYENAKHQQKLRIEAKSMPKDQPVPAQPSTDPQPVKGPPKAVLERRATEAAAKQKVKPPPNLDGLWGC